MSDMVSAHRKLNCRKASLDRRWFRSRPGPFKVRKKISIGPSQPLILKGSISDRQTCLDISPRLVKIILKDFRKLVRLMEQCGQEKTTDAPQFIVVDEFVGVGQNFVGAEHQGV